MSLVHHKRSASTLPEALDQAASTAHGMTFYDGRGRVAARASFAELRDRARDLGRRLLGLDVAKGDKIAIVAETRLEFAALFFACQYAGLVPVPLTAIVNLGGRDNYVKQLSFLIRNCEARAVFASDEFIEFVNEAVADAPVQFAGDVAEFVERFDAAGELPAVAPEDLAYVQYTSGSTRVARGTLISQRAVMCNLHAIVRDGLKIRPDDSFFSWLPFYHDMGLVGKLLSPVVGQVPVSYLGSRDFALRPRLWLKLLDETQATISFAPSFGYGLCARRLRSGEGQRYNLSNWRIAGVGAEMIRRQTMEGFVAAVAGSGFDEKVLFPCYGMAEVGLAISFSPAGSGVQVDYVDRDLCMNERVARPLGADDGAAVQEFVDCGLPLPGIQVEIRDEHGALLPERHIGRIWLKTDSVMEGYLNAPEATAEALSGDGWLNTGDLGYLRDGRVVITGREKDLIIINGRNYWPQDLEYEAEQFPGVRSGDVMAFSFPDASNEEKVVVLVQCRETEEAKREALRRNIRGRIRTEFACDCRVELVDAHTLPRTSSGKPSRSRARADFAASLTEKAAEALEGETLLQARLSAAG